MSKTSIMGLVLGLLFLGILFFVIGFLAAVATLKPDEKQHSSQSAWQDSHSFSQQDSSHGQKSGKWGRIAGAVGANLVGQALHKPLGKIAGAASSVVPQPLKPFARYGIGSTRTAARNTGREMNPFYPHRMAAPAQQPPQPPISQQPYMAPQAQPYYGTPTAPEAYPQAPAPFQGGYAGYAPLQQQQAPPPPYYQPQPQMRPPQYPQPQYSQYPQQVAPQW